MTNKMKSRTTRGGGSLRHRGGNSWELKFYATDPATDIRKARYVTVKANNAKEAGKLLRAKVVEADDGAYLAPTKKAFGEALDNWERTLNVSPKTAERYKELVRLHIRPHLGAEKLQLLKSSRIAGFYIDLLQGRGPNGEEGSRKLAPRTISHIHRLMVQVLTLAVEDDLIKTNPALQAKRPMVERAELEILSEAEAANLMVKFHGRNATTMPMYHIAAIGLATGMRRGEILALRWKDVALDGAELQVQQSLEQTKTALRFKAPKTKRGRRTLSLPSFLVKELRALKVTQNAERLALGLGKDPDDALVLRRPDGLPFPPDNVSSDWRKAVEALGVRKVSLHALRHTHASQLIAAGLDVLTISRRLGHAKPSITLDVYGHLFKPTDQGAAAVFDKAFGGLQSD